MKNELYRRLAADGNANAKNLLGSFPVHAIDQEDSEEEELEDLEELGTMVAILTAKAQAHALTRNHALAADAHMQRGQMLEGAGRHQEAMDAYKSGAMSLYQHMNDGGGCAGMPLPQIQAIHARMNAEGK